MEVWQSIPEFPRYEVSNTGRVRTSPNAIDALGRTRYSGRILDQWFLKNGYKNVILRNSLGRPCNRLVHRLVMQSFVGKCPKGIQVNHKNGDKSDNRIDNLEYVTPGENYKHALRVLRHKPPSGENHWATSCADDQVAEVRRRAMNGETHSKLAEEFGVSVATISRWRNGRRTAGGHKKPDPEQLNKIRSRASRKVWEQRRLGQPQPISG